MILNSSFGNIKFNHFFSFINILFSVLKVFLLSHAICLGFVENLIQTLYVKITLMQFNFIISKQILREPQHILDNVLKCQKT